MPYHFNYPLTDKKGARKEPNKMRRMLFTDIAIRNLPATAEHKTYWDTSLPTFGIRVGLRSRTFIVMRGSDRKRISLGRWPKTPLKVARQAALRIIDQGTVIGAYHRAPACAQCVDDYLRDLNASPRWVKEQERLLTKHFLADHGQKSLSEVTTKNVTDITDELKKRGAPSEALHVHKALRSLFNFSLNRHFIASSPMDRLPLPTTPKSRDRVLSDNELRRVYIAAQSMGNPYGYIILLCIHCMFRLNEAAQMKWSYISPEYFTLPAEFTKQRREHVVPNLIGDNIAEIPRTSEYLFPSSSGRPFSAFSKNKVELDRRSQVENFTTHDLRRTAASKAAEWKCGMPHVIERALGHSAGSMTPLARIYNRYDYLDEV